MEQFDRLLAEQERWHEPFRKGDKVKTENATGYIEEDWRIKEFFLADRTVLIEKDGTQKFVHLDNLKRANKGNSRTKSVA